MDLKWFEAPFELFIYNSVSIILKQYLFKCAHQRYFIRIIAFLVFKNLQYYYMIE